MSETTTVKTEDFTEAPSYLSCSTTASHHCWSSYPDGDPQLYSQFRGNYRGERLENFHERKAAGELLPMTNYSRWDEESEGSMTIRAHYNNGYGCSADVYTSNIAWNLQKEDPGTVELYTALKVNEDALLLSAVSNSVPRLDILTSVAETHKTLDLVVQARKRAVALIKQLQKKGWKALPRTASDTWLEWRYGWRLLGFEIEAVTEAINHPLKSLFVEGRAGESHVVEYESIGDSFPLLHSHLRVNANTTVQHRHDISVRANVNGKVKLQSANVLASPVVTGWELIPYSFVLDWFVNVGDVLTAWKAFSLADYTFSIGVKRVFDLSGTISGITYYDSAYTSASASGVSSLKGETKIRWSRTKPSLIPQLNVDLTTPRSIDIAALLYSTSTSLRR